ncbi:uncharacterized protein C1orf198 homolog [Anoplophora glabripennis]|uniref:uncharacterized protein C1orf198 homolog n=1 Tax=Anoplophora glabripennis TaxID=217634 RepID=UPI00087429CD|nr:uncharacterized protein C1orf198 homolog [Anoplophora glabripennis]
MSLKTAADEYFSNLNSIAARLYTDLEETKSSYDKLWTTLSEKEQQDILSESIIKPEISIQYSSKEKKSKNDYAVKLIFDDHCSYRDEHSGPFSFRTQSQRDLNIFQTDKPKVISEKKLKVTKPKAKIPVKFQEVEHNQKDELLEGESLNMLPKTGLDFLDNW